MTSGVSATRFSSTLASRRSGFTPHRRPPQPRTHPRAFSRAHGGRGRERWRRHEPTDAADAAEPAHAVASDGPRGWDVRARERGARLGDRRRARGGGRGSAVVVCSAVQSSSVSSRVSRVRPRTRHCRLRRHRCDAPESEVRRDRDDRPLRLVTRRRRARDLPRERLPRLSAPATSAAPSGARRRGGACGRRGQRRAHVDKLVRRQRRDRRDEHAAVERAQRRARRARGIGRIGRMERSAIASAPIARGLRTTRCGPRWPFRWQRREWGQGRRCREEERGEIARGELVHLANRDWLCGVAVRAALCARRDCGAGSEQVVVISVRNRVGKVLRVPVTRASQGRPTGLGRDVMRLLVSSCAREARNHHRSRHHRGRHRGKGSAPVRGRLPAQHDTT